MRISDWSSDVCSSDLDLELDRARRVAVHLPREDPGAVAVPGRRAAGGRTRWRTDPGRRRAPAAARRREARAAPRALPHARLLDRTSGVTRKVVSVRVDLGGRRNKKKKKRYNKK